MDTQISQEDKDRIEAGIHGKYKKVAKNPEGLFKYPTGRAGLETLGYNPELIQGLPESVVASYCGVGNPFSIWINKQGRYGAGHWLWSRCGHVAGSYDGRAYGKSCWN